MLRAVGIDLYEGATKVRLVGVNDTTAFAMAIFSKGAPNYKYANHNFPNYTGDTTTHIPANSYREFWWKYFWLCNHLGINAVRFNSGRWEMDLLHTCWYGDRAYFDQLMLDMLDMAYANGVYVIFCFGGPNQDGSGDPGTFDRVSFNFDKRINLLNPMSGSILEPGTEACNHYVEWMGEVVAAYKMHPGLGIWDLSNEPDHDVQYNTFWKIKYPTTWAQAFVTWAQTVTDAVKAVDHTHPIMVGTGGGLMFDWGEDWYDMRNTGSDVTGVHFYASVEGPTNEYLFATRQAWSNNLNKPTFFSEVGWSSNSPPWETSYWPWADQMGQKYDISIAWMQLNDAPSYGIPSYPGYPITQAVMDAIPPLGVTPPTTQTNLWPYVIMGAAFVGAMIYLAARPTPTH